jgi:hypothetical protein
MAWLHIQSEDLGLDVPSIMRSGFDRVRSLRQGRQGVSGLLQRFNYIASSLTLTVYSPLLPVNFNSRFLTRSTEIRGQVEKYSLC